MSTNKLTIKLTEDQQKQIKNATGKTFTELNIDFASTGELTGKQLEDVAGGVADGGKTGSDDWNT